MDPSLVPNEVLCAPLSCNLPANAPQSQSSNLVTRTSTDVQASTSYDQASFSFGSVAASFPSSSFSRLESGSAIKAPFTFSPPSFISESRVKIKGNVSSCDGVHPVQLSAREMGNFFAKELRPELVKESFVLSKILFSGGPLKDVNFDDTLLGKMEKTWDAMECKWKYPLDLSSETKVAKWLNVIGRNFAEVTRVPLLRAWSAESCAAPLQAGSSDSTIKVKPDLILKLIARRPPHPLQQNSQRTHRRPPPSWSNIAAFGEVTTQPTYHTILRQTVYTKSHVLFVSQESRRFIPSIAFHGKKDSMTLQLNLIDREGVVYETFPFKTATNGYAVLRVIAGFMCGDEVSLGFDPTVTLNDHGDVVAMDVQGLTSKKTYFVDQKLHVATGLTGRCTRVWQAHSSTDPTQSVIIKDAWPSIAKALKESQMLARLKGVTGIPNIITAVTIKIPEHGGQPEADTFDTTDRVRRDLAPRNYRTRKHRRVVMGTLGIKVHHFETVSELIGAFRDVIAGE